MVTVSTYFSNAIGLIILRFSINLCFLITDLEYRTQVKNNKRNQVGFTFHIRINVTKFQNIETKKIFLTYNINMSTNLNFLI